MVKEEENLLFECEFCMKSFEPHANSILEIPKEVMSDAEFKKMEDEGDSFLQIPVFSQNTEFHYSAKRFIRCCNKCREELFAEF